MTIARTALALTLFASVSLFTSQSFGEESSKSPDDCTKLEKLSVSLVRNVGKWMKATTADVKQENLKVISEDAQTLRKHAPKCPEKLTITDFEASFFVEYKVGNIKQDVFNFGPTGLLTSWVRDGKNGKSQALKF